MAHRWDLRSPECRGKKIDYGVFLAGDCTRTDWAASGERLVTIGKKSFSGKATQSKDEASPIPMTIDILLVDDNAIQAATRKAILTRVGRSVAVACDGEEALKMLNHSAQSVGLVITDHLMPGMNGPEFVTGLRMRYPRLPVLVLSGLPDAEDAYTELDVVFRVKPLPPDELLSLVRSLLTEPMGRTA